MDPDIGAGNSRWREQATAGGGARVEENG